MVGGLPTDRRIFDLSRTELSDAWSFAFSGDYSAGGSDGSWGSWLVLGYHFGSEDRYGVRLGYRHLEVELGDDDRDAKLETDIVLSGMLVGFTFGF